MIETYEMNTATATVTAPTDQEVFDLYYAALTADAAFQAEAIRQFGEKAAFYFRNARKAHDRKTAAAAANKRTDAAWYAVAK